MPTSAKILAIGTLSAPPSSAEIVAVLPKEVPPTLRLYLDGHMDQFWVRSDNAGVVFLLNAATVDEAQALLGELPLTKAGLMKFEYLPVGPLAPLGTLLGAR